MQTLVGLLLQANVVRCSKETKHVLERSLVHVVVNMDIVEMGMIIAREQIVSPGLVPNKLASDYSTLQNRPHPLRKRRFCRTPVSSG
jgi:hypothetical protein